MSENFHLTGVEQAIVANADFFYAKHRIIEKVYLLFGEMSKKYGSLLSVRPTLLPGEVSLVPPKIYRGENYRQLPYVMLDHPRFFKPHKAFSIRSLFWWGQHFSIHLVLGGDYAAQYQEAINKRIANGLPADWHYAVTPDPWHHHFEDGNYTPVNESATGKIMANEPPGYIKLGRKLSLDHWEKADIFFTDSFSQLISMLSNDSETDQEKRSLSR